MDWLVVKMLLSLGAVLGLMGGIVVVLKRYVMPGRVSGDTPIAIEILAQKSLQPRRSVVVLKVLDKVLVVGMSEHGMHPLSEMTSVELDRAMECAEGHDAVSTKPPARRRVWQDVGSFAHLLQSHMQPGAKK